MAGHNVRTVEAVIPPRKLHSAQQIRTANYILQSTDPTGINAAGKGSNVGQAVVFHYAAEILRTAWDKTGEQRYLDGIVEKARKVLDVQPKFTDDLAHRILFFQRVFPPAVAASWKAPRRCGGLWSARGARSNRTNGRCVLRSEKTAPGGSRQESSILSPIRLLWRWRSMRWFRWAEASQIQRLPKACKLSWRCKTPMAVGTAQPRPAS